MLPVCTAGYDKKKAGENNQYIFHMGHDRSFLRSTLFYRKSGSDRINKIFGERLGPSNIQVNCVAPGVIDTEMNKFLNSSEMNELINDTPLLRVGRTDEAAHAVFYLASEHADFITGQVLSPNGGYLI